MGMDRLGAYRIERELGSGGMGRVFAASVQGRALGLIEGDRVALKVVHPHLLETDGFFLRFMREAQLGASIQHENVVRTHHCDQVVVDGKPNAFLVMEYVEGQDLRALLAELDRVPEELCRHVGREVAKGLNAIHGAGVVHRDLKPENVLITSDQIVKVMDLGVARLADEQMRLSQSGAFVGSVEYAAPEQFEGTVDHRCDLHALGLLLYELACGQHPFRGDDFRGVMRRVCESEPRRAGDVNPQLSAFFEEVVHTLLAKDPDARFADAAELLVVLQEGEESEWWHARALAMRASTSRPLRRIRVPRETAVYGRDRELERLRTLYAQAASGKGGVLLIAGEAGIGKSRLVDELAARLQDEDHDLNFLFGSYPPGGAASVSGAFSTAFREQFGDAGSSRYLNDTPLLVPAFDAVLRGDVTPEGAHELTTASLATCFIQAARSLAEERTTVLLIDDLHFAAADAHSLFTALALAVPDHRVLLIGTTRPGSDSDWRRDLQRLEHVSVMELDRLYPKDLAKLLEDSFQSEQLAANLSHKIAVKSDGNPFFAFEIIRGLREGQFITQRKDGTWVSTRVIEEIEIPSSVLDLVNARVGDLDEDERNLLDLASCCGFEFDPLVVGSALGMGRIPVLRSLGQIERRHRLVRSQGRTYAFDHHQVQEALYGALNEYLREEYHAAVADALETSSGARESDPNDLDGALCTELCAHFLNAGLGERAFRYFPAARDHLMGSHLPADAVDLTDRILAVPGLLNGIERARTFLDLANPSGPLDRMGATERQEALVGEAARILEVTDDHLQFSRLENTRGGLLMRSGRLTEAEAAFRRALEFAEASDDRRVIAHTLANVAIPLGRRGNHQEATAMVHRALDIALAQADTDTEAHISSNLGSHMIDIGRPDEARTLIERALELRRAQGNLISEAQVVRNLGAVLAHEGRWTDALRHFERATALSRSVGDRRGEAASLMSVSMAQVNLRRPAETRQTLENCMAIRRELGDRVGETHCRVGLANLMRSEGHHADAIEPLTAAIEFWEEIGDLQFAAVSAANLAAAWSALGEPARARATANVCIERAREFDGPHPESYGWQILGLTASDLGDADEARRCFERSANLRRRIGHRDALALLLGSLGDEVRREGHADEARRILREALAIARDLENPPLVARSLAILAQVPGEDSEPAVAAVRELEGGLTSDVALMAMYRTTGDRDYLRQAKALLDAKVEKAPSQYHEGMRTRPRINREILAAWETEFGGDQSPGTESVTRVG